MASSTLQPTQARFSTSNTGANGAGYNKFLLRLLGNQNRVESFLKSVPKGTQAIIQAPAAFISLGGLLRLVSKLSGEREGLYKTGYWMSNGVRAFSAAGEALRGLVDENKCLPVTLGACGNFAASFVPNGLKHCLFGVFNVFLFVGKALQRAYLQQKVYSKPVNKTEIDPKPLAKKVTKNSTDAFNKTMASLKKKGFSSFWAEMLASVSSTVVGTKDMLVDTIKHPSLVFGVKERMSQANDTKFVSIPSPAHVFNTVGILSGLSAAVAGTIGRSEKYGDVSSDDGFNPLGKYLVSFANFIPAVGLLTNSFEIQNNTEKFPTKFKGFHGETVRYNPKASGLMQGVSVAGLGLVSLGNLANGSIASLYDVFSGGYQFGVGKEQMMRAYQFSRKSLNGHATPSTAA